MVLGDSDVAICPFTPSFPALSLLSPVLIARPYHFVVCGSQSHGHPCPTGFHRLCRQWDEDAAALLKRLLHMNTACKSSHRMLVSERRGLQEGSPVD
ncbi:hypothetical protein cyc_07258 [Cyclospora cayetanensis]|uniref:Uncharacterized protein n=1 Tax=Cyclospora cayetanensis TaxID=88456 RepID=A0A1D3D299_9EIME|nr:hypothetical protein cyc_07258 [Cyclospora cayetanensis]